MKKERNSPTIYASVDAKKKLWFKGLGASLFVCEYQCYWHVILNTAYKTPTLPFSAGEEGDAALDSHQ